MDDEKKKKPGRPKKNPVNLFLTKEGVVDSPQNSLDTPEGEKFVLEVLYENPSMFKKILSVFKNMNSKTINIKFTKDKMYFAGMDHLKKNKIISVIYGRRLNRYYCEEEMELDLSACSSKRILQELNKECAIIGFTIMKRQIYNKLVLITKNSEFDIETFTGLDVSKSTFDWDVENIISSAEEYPLRFDLSFKLFKSKVNIFKSCSDIMSIEKNGGEPLKISAAYNDKRNETSSHFKDDKKINLVSKLEDDELLAISVHLEYVKSVVGTAVSNTISLLLDHNKDIIFEFTLDCDEVPSERKHIEQSNTERAKIYIITEIIKL
jgi:hypothetical protein